jgi:DNA-binding sugar fermentation-stimulating protein
MLYLVQRADAETFGLAADIDPIYAAAYERAQTAGVEMLCYRCRMSPQGISIDRRIDITVSSRWPRSNPETKSRRRSYQKPRNVKSRAR